MDKKPKKIKKPDGENEESDATASHAPEFGGRKGPEPTRFGDWEKDGRCVDF